MKLLAPLPTFQAPLPSPPSTSSPVLAGKTDSSSSLPSLDGLTATVALVLQYSTATSHPLFLDKLYTAPDPLGHISELLTSILNTNVHVYAASPVFSLMERNIITTLGTQYVRYPTDECDGLLCPGGSYSNLMSFLVARHLRFPHVKTEGWRVDDRPVCFVSASAHYSILKAANTLGVGQNAVRTIAVDRKGRMDVDALRAALSDSRSRRETPFYVCATLGTTTLGAFDPVHPIADLLDADCQEGVKRIHLHVDASWGGGLLFHPTLRQQLDGVERSDSCTVNPHKLLGVPLQCSLLLVRHPAILVTATSIQADYLFHHHPDGELDLGTRTLQCGRHNDALKRYLAWCLRSDVYFASLMNRAATHAITMARMIRRDTRFSLLFLSPASNVCFFYLPAFIRDRWHREVEPVLADRWFCLDQLENDENMEWHRVTLPELTPVLTRLFPVLDLVPARLYRAMQEDGRLLVNFGNLPEYSSGLPFFLRLVLHNPLTTLAHLQVILDTIDTLAQTIDWPAILAGVTNPADGLSS